jgi:(p)ppGpp synthase/HD superfamily hydrolase
VAEKKMGSEHDLINKARHYATQAHKRINHRRKYTNQPYDIHLKAVAERVGSVSDDPEMIAAAWLHDTVEDTPVTFHDIEKEFGQEIGQLVSDLTDVSKISDGNRAVRKAIDRAHLAQAEPRAKTIKLADLIDNCRDICSNNPRFARVYLTEMAALLEVLGDGDTKLFEQAKQLLSDSAAAMKMERVPILSQSFGEDSLYSQGYSRTSPVF